MGAQDHLRMREKLLANGAADEHTIFVANHFSHNGLVPHEELRLAHVTQRRDQISRRASNYKHVVYFPGFMSSDFLFIYIT